MFSKEEMEQCLFHVYRCVQLFGQDFIPPAKSRKASVSSI